MNTLNSVSSHQLAIQYSKDGDLFAALSALEDCPKGARDLVLHRAQVESNLRRYVPKRPLRFAQPAVGLDAFGELPHWNPFTSLIIWGVPGLGKTTLAKALLGEPLLLVRHKDKLKQWDQSMTGIIFDDFSVKHLHRTIQIAWLDCFETTQLDVKHSMVELQAGTRRIFTFNEGPDAICDFFDEALKRRITVWKMIARDVFILEWEPPEQLKTCKCHKCHPEHYQ